MKNPRTLLAVGVLTLALTACGESSTLMAPAEARFDGGLGYGSGNRSDSTTVSTTTTDSDSTTTSRGGHGIGSGN